MYWDEIGTIAPAEYLEQPEVFDATTQRLFQLQLVTPVIPGHYTSLIPHFRDSFQNFIETIDGRVLAKRRCQVHDLKELALPMRVSRRVDLAEIEGSTKFGVAPVHFQKLEQLGAFLVDAGLARECSPWFIVPGIGS